MLKTRIILSTPNDTVDFVTKASKCDFDIDIDKGSTHLDGKSIEGLMSLQLGVELDCTIHATRDEAHKFINEIKIYMVKDFE